MESGGKSGRFRVLPWVQGLARPRLTPTLGNYGPRRGKIIASISSVSRKRVPPEIATSALSCPRDAVRQGVPEQDLPCLAQRKPLPPMISHGIPVLPDDGGKVKTGAARPHRRKAGFIQAPPASQERPARGRADISPRWHAQPGRPSDGTVGGSSSGSRSVRRFHSGRTEDESVSGRGGRDKRQH